MSAVEESTVQKTGFAVTPDWILDADISDRAIRLFAVLDRFEGKNQTAYPSRKTLAERLKCSVASVDRALAELVEIGAVQTTKRHRKDGSLTSCDYWLWPKTPHHSDDVPSPVIVPLPSPVTQHEVTTVRSNNTQLSLVSEQVADRPTIHQQAFDKLWEMYPRKIGKSDSMKVITSLLKSRVPIDQLAQATRNYAMLRAGQDQSYTMHPKTFYSKDRWRDYLDDAYEIRTSKPLTKESLDKRVDDAMTMLRILWSNAGATCENPVVIEALRLRTLRQLGMMNENELRYMLREIARLQ